MCNTFSANHSYHILSRMKISESGENDFFGEKERMISDIYDVHIYNMKAIMKDIKDKWIVKGYIISEENSEILLSRESGQQTKHNFWDKSSLYSIEKEQALSIQGKTWCSIKIHVLKRGSCIMAYPIWLKSIDERIRNFAEILMDKWEDKRILNNIQLQTISLSRRIAFHVLEIWQYLPPYKQILQAFCRPNKSPDDDDVVVVFEGFKSRLPQIHRILHHIFNVIAGGEIKQHVPTSTTSRQQLFGSITLREEKLS
ncbi:hypothetical protein LXL04_028057 [Taraxacum kok-saghyz]